MNAAQCLLWEQLGDMLGGCLYVMYDEIYVAPVGRRRVDVYMNVCLCVASGALREAGYLYPCKSSWARLARARLARKSAVTQRAQASKVGAKTICPFARDIT